MLLKRAIGMPKAATTWPKHCVVWPVATRHFHLAAVYKVHAVRTQQARRNNEGLRVPRRNCECGIGTVEQDRSRPSLLSLARSLLSIA